MDRGRGHENIQLIIDPGQVFFLKFILEGYDNLFILSTIDREKGVVRIAFPASEKKLLNNILNTLKDKIKAHEIIKN